MKHLLLTTIAAVVLVGCGPPKPPDISIHYAAGEGNIEAVKQHLAAGADVNANDTGLTPLHYAAGEGHKELVELLIVKGADVSAKNKFGETPLHWAAGEGHKELVELLIANGADVNARRSKYGGGYTPLHVAATEGHKEIAELLINKGSDVNAKEDFLGRTPLHYAGTKEMIELLIDNGADVNAKANGITPLDWAIQREQTEIAEPLRKHGGKTGEQLKAEGK